MCLKGAVFDADSQMHSAHVLDLPLQENRGSAPGIQTPPSAAVTVSQPQPEQKVVKRRHEDSEHVPSIVVSGAVESGSPIAGLSCCGTE